MQKTKIILTGFAGAVLMMSAANAASTLATEPFVRSAVDYAVDTSNDYTDQKLNDLATGGVTLTGYATEEYADDAGTAAVTTANTYTDTKIQSLGITETTPLGSAAFQETTYFDAAGAAATAQTAAQTNAASYTDAAVANKATLQGAGDVEVATVDATGQYVRSGISVTQLNAMAGDITGKADAVTSTGGTGTKVTYNTQGIVTGATNAEISDVTGLQAALDAKQNDLTFGTVGTVMVSTGTGYEWATTTPDTFTPTIEP